MNPGLIFFLAVFLPVLFATLLCGPLYAGMCGGLYFYYGEEVIQYFYDPGYVIPVYEQLYNQWSASEGVYGFTDFVFPVFGPLILGLLLALLLLWWIVSYIRNIFILTS